jgi:phosphoribosylformylglycinamidine synthase subunit PurSL
VTLWEIDIHPAEGMPDAEGRRIAADAGDLGLPGNLTIRAAHGYLLQGDLQREQVERLAAELFSDSVVERTVVAPIGDALLNQSPEAVDGPPLLIHVLRKPGVMDPVAQSAEQAIADFGLQVEAIRTLRKYWVSGLDPAEVALFGSKILANDSIEQIILGPLELTELHVGSPYLFQLVTVPIRELDDDALWWCLSVFEDNAGVIEFDDELRGVLQGRDAQPSLGDRALRRGGHRHRRGDPRPDGHRAGRQTDRQHRRVLLRSRRT